MQDYKNPKRTSVRVQANDKQEYILRGTNERNKEKKKKRKVCLLVGKQQMKKKVPLHTVPEAETADKYICHGCEGSSEEACKWTQ
jgi:hypothetical protein